LTESSAAQTEGEEDIFHQERGGLFADAGRLHVAHWIVISLSLLLTVAAWHFSSKQQVEKIEERFGRDADQVVALVSERMQKYEDALWSGVSAIQSQGGEFSHAEWRSFASHLRLGAKYPGIMGIGVIYRVLPEQLDAHLAEQRRSRPNFHLHPQHAENEFWPITYIEPEASNFFAVGLDMAHESNRYRAAQLARDSGLAQITGPIVLVQDSRTPGFLFFAPFYRGGLYESPEDRRENLIGLVYAPFVFKKLMEGTLGKEQRQLGVRIMDGDEVLHDEHLADEEDYDPDSSFAKSYSVEMYGRKWVFDIRGTNSFRESTASNQPLVILSGGLAIDLLLFLLFLSLARANRRAVEYADQVTEQLQDKTKDLERSNLELEEFAYVASHDLKTPLRGIGDLAEYLTEDLEDYVAGPDADPSVKKNLGRIQTQVQRMDGLIKGILDYSRVGSRTPELEEIDVGELARQIRDDLRLSETQCIVEGDLPTLRTDATQLSQILNNLMGNALKYHDDPDHIVIRISVERRSDEVLISVADNGPGIDPRFHAKIFDVFQTLHSKDEVDSTGIGLSIVKKMVEHNGGKVAVSSQLGEGATFTFSWPTLMTTAQDDDLQLDAPGARLRWPKS